MVVRRKNNRAPRDEDWVMPATGISVTSHSSFLADFTQI